MCLFYVCLCTEILPLRSPPSDTCMCEQWGYDWKLKGNKGTHGTHCSQQHQQPIWMFLFFTRHPLMLTSRSILFTSVPWSTAQPHQLHFSSQILLNKCLSFLFVMQSNIILSQLPHIIIFLLLLSKIRPRYRSQSGTILCYLIMYL